MGKLLRFGVIVLVLSLAFQSNWLSINWSRIQGDLGINKLIDPETNRLRPLK